MEFKKWFESQFDYNQPTQIMGATNTNQADITQVGSSDSARQFKNKHAGQLANAHSTLKDVFAKIRQSHAFYDPSTKKSFERELIKGIDGVGRSHAILAAQ